MSSALADFNSGAKRGKGLKYKPAKRNQKNSKVDAYNDRKSRRVRRAPRRRLRVQQWSPLRHGLNQEPPLRFGINRVQALRFPPARPKSTFASCKEFVNKIIEDINHRALAIKKWTFTSKVHTVVPTKRSIKPGPTSRRIAACEKLVQKIQKSKTDIRQGELWLSLVKNMKKWTSLDVGKRKKEKILNKHPLVPTPEMLEQCQLFINRIRQEISYIRQREMWNQFAKQVKKWTFPRNRENPKTMFTRMTRQNKLPPLPPYSELQLPEGWPQGEELMPMAPDRSMIQGAAPEVSLIAGTSGNFENKDTLNLLVAGTSGNFENKDTLNLFVAGTSGNFENNDTLNLLVAGTSGNFENNDTLNLLVAGTSGNFENNDTLNLLVAGTSGNFENNDTLNLLVAGTSGNFENNETLNVSLAGTSRSFENNETPEVLLAGSSGSFENNIKPGTSWGRNDNPIPADEIPGSSQTWVRIQSGQPESDPDRSDLERNESLRSVECPVCNENLTPTGIQFFGCAHEFHETCLRGWIDKDLLCPACQASVET